MILALIALLVGVLAFLMFSISINLSSINRIVSFTPIDIFESSIPLLDEGDMKNPHFDKELLRSKLTSYYDASLPKYTKDYALALLFYDSNNGSYCLSNYCKAVQVKIDAKTVYNYTYSRTLTYEIKEANYGQR